MRDWAGLVIGRRIGRFTVEAPLGAGGFATVWRARDELLGRAVALKVMNDALLDSPKARRRFLHEAQAAAALEHPGIGAVYDFGEADGQWFIALQLVDGETVSDLAARSPLPCDQAARIVVAAADAIEHAHARGVIHRDVSGRNIMVARDDRVVVLDFGLALVAGQSRLTSMERALGSLHWMAPEVLLGQQGDARSDIYGLGVVLYEALTGTYPHAFDPETAIFYAATNRKPVPPRERRPDVPEALERVVLKAIALEADQRYQTAEELAAALRALESGSEVVEDAAPPGPGAPGPPSTGD